MFSPPPEERIEISVLPAGGGENGKKKNTYQAQITETTNNYSLITIKVVYEV